MEYTGTWREIWTQKGAMEGGIDDLYIYDGWEKSKADIEKTAKLIIQELEINPEDRVLEAGCGAGALAQYMDCDYVGIDFSRTLLQKHITFFGNSVLYAEANDIPFKDGWFDKAYCWGVFQYFESKEYAAQAIKEMERVTRAGGKNPGRRASHGVPRPEAPPLSEGDVHRVESGGCLGRAV